MDLSEKTGEGEAVMPRNKAKPLKGARVKKSGGFQPKSTPGPWAKTGVGKKNKAAKTKKGGAGGGH